MTLPMLYEHCRHETAFSDAKAPRTPAWNYSGQDHHWLISEQQPLSTLDAEESDEMFRRRWRTLISVDNLVGNLIDTLTEMVSNRPHVYGRTSVQCSSALQ